MITDAAELIDGSSAWGAGDRDALQKWVSEYAKHLQSSHVKYERRSHNHGTYFDVQYLTVLRCGSCFFFFFFFPHCPALLRGRRKFLLCLRVYGCQLKGWYTVITTVLLTDREIQIIMGLIFSI